MSKTAISGATDKITAFLVVMEILFMTKLINLVSGQNRAIFVNVSKLIATI